MTQFMRDLYNELISYGGMVATRAEVYADAFAVGLHNARLEGYTEREAKSVAHKWADVYSFGPQANILLPDEVAVRLRHGLRFDPQTGNPVQL